jgi:hypothetical protein
MTSQRTSAVPVDRRPRIPRQRVRAFDGLTWKGLALVALLCLINGTRRTVQDLLGGEDTFFDWLIKTSNTTAHGLIVAAPVVLAVVATYNLAPRKPSLRYATLALAVALSSFVGIFAGLAFEIATHCSGSYADCFEEHPAMTLFRNWVRYGSLCALFSVVFVYLRSADESVSRAQEADRERQQFVQRMMEARLRMLQAQIEPHFLFNTLANVRRLYQTDPAAGESMLENLMRYFEVALPQMRAASSTLGREAALTEAYLEIQRIRMGRRLAFEIAIPESLRDAPVPPMMLVTLAENAIKHGLAPLPEGGRVHVSAAASGDELEMRVADTGRGFMHSSGGGTGLANIRARLAGLHGAAARLTLALNSPRGVVATIAVPLSSATNLAVGTR